MVMNMSKLGGRSTGKPSSRRRIRSKGFMGINSQQIFEYDYYHKEIADLTTTANLRIIPVLDYYSTGI